MTTTELLEKASARPWRLDRPSNHGSIQDDWNLAERVVASGAVIAATIEGERISPEAKANAALIVAAVNSFEAMRAALEALIFEVETSHIDWARFNRESPDYDASYKPEFPVCVKQARKALTLASGGGQ